LYPRFARPAHSGAHTQTAPSPAESKAGAIACRECKTQKKLHCMTADRVWF
jgi:hypothetical protein